MRVFHCLKPQQLYFGTGRPRIMRVCFNGNIGKMIHLNLELRQMNAEKFKSLLGKGYLKNNIGKYLKTCLDLNQKLN